MNWLFRNTAALALRRTVWLVAIIVVSAGCYSVTPVTEAAKPLRFPLA